MTAMLPQRPDATTYTFASEPRAVKSFKPRKKFREPIHQSSAEGLASYGNIMYDRRIVRGNTYALQTLPAAALPDPIELQKQQENRRRALARRRAKDQFRPKTPDAVEGRRHVYVQTELYLEELSDFVEETDMDTQTDAFLDRPPSPLFVPAKTGLDVETQIYEGDLFDFDIEVKPILEVIVGKTIEQSLLEVMEEEELYNMRQQQRIFTELRNAELVEQQRLEEQDRRHKEEKERRMKQQKEVLVKGQETAEKIAARAYAHGYLADLVPSVFGTLTETGYFFDAIERDVEQHFLPWLMEEVVDHLDRKEYGRLALDGLLREVVFQRTETYNKLEREALNKANSPGDSETPAEAAPVEIEGAAVAEKTEGQEEQAPEPSNESVDAAPESSMVAIEETED
ncbi:Radial spoke head protein 3 [Nucella lapillus]